MKSPDLKSAQLVINGKPSDKDSGLLFGDFIRHLNKDLAAKSEVISILKVDGELIDESKENKLAMINLGKMGRIEITTVDQVELAFEALSSAKAYAKKLVVFCKTNGKSYKVGNTKEADKNFVHLVEGLENLTQLILASQSILRGKFKGIHTNDSSLRIAQVRLVSAIEELLPAKKASDYVMLADILCNELPEALEEIAIYGIPVLQRLKNT